MVDESKERLDKRVSGIVRPAMPVETAESLAWRPPDDEIYIAGAR